MTTISVVVPVHRDGPQLRRCLAALQTSEVPPDETIVVVDGGDPGLCATVAPAADLVVPLRPRSGPAQARNLGAQHAAGDIVLFIDSDVAVHPDTVARARAAFSDDHTLDAVIGSYDDSPADTHVLSQYKNLLHHYVHQQARAQAETFWGACGAIRRDRFLQLGGFDASRYPRPSIEDIELGYRLVAAGARIRLDAALQVTHLKRWSPWELLRTDVRDRAVPWSELLLERGRFTNDLNVDVRGRVKVAAAATGATAAVAALALPRPPNAARGTAAAAAAALLVLDAPLLQFWAARRGWMFAFRALGWHWFSYLYSGAAFAWALRRHRTARSQAPPHAHPPLPDLSRTPGPGDA